VAHPDDDAYGVAAVVALHLADPEFRFFLVHATDGEGGAIAEGSARHAGDPRRRPPKLRRDPLAGTRHIRLRRLLLGHPGGYSLPRSVADRGVADRTEQHVRHHRLLPNDRSPAPGAHRGRNLRRALTTPHRHPPSGHTWDPSGIDHAARPV
jgi:hypothetical protein